ncbi:MAG: hypothetical protein U5R49_26040 [Deltaproteobacteria bacterium]|nr:hypothetical protein [Deltaproteobacteria bacterium]
MDYTYAIHEAFYDKNGHVGSITQDPIEPFGENIEKLYADYQQQHQREESEEK